MRRIGRPMADGPRILLVEDDVLIGMMLVDMFDALGLPEPAQATTNGEALALIASESLAGALVDINLGDEKGWPIADALAERDIPFAFTSGGGDVIPAEHAHRRLVTKPFRISDIEAVLGEFSAHP